MPFTGMLERLGRVWTRRDQLKPIKLHARYFVLTEASGDSSDDSVTSSEQSSASDADLSGFIVADDAELSYYSSSESESHEDHELQWPRRKLYRGRRPVISDDDDESEPEDPVGDSLIDHVKFCSLRELDAERNQDTELVQEAKPFCSVERVAVAGKTHDPLDSGENDANDEVQGTQHV